MTCSRSAWLVLLLGCGPGFKQVPQSQPHGQVHLRVAHVPADIVYDDEATIDYQRVSLSKQTALRLSPGVHHIRLMSTGHTYALEVLDVRNPWGRCVDPRCAVLGPTLESRQQLVESGRWRCSRDLELDVQRDGDLAVILMADADARCRACVLNDGRAINCPDDK